GPTSAGRGAGSRPARSGSSARGETVAGPDRGGRRAGWPPRPATGPARAWPLGSPDVAELVTAAPASALAIYAHPDDPEVSCGGTLARWAAAGTVVEGGIARDGDKGP